MERPLPRQPFVGPPRPGFQTTSRDVRTCFEGKKVVLVTNVFGDGMGDLGQGKKLAGLLHDLGAEVTFVPCCLESDRPKVEDNVRNEDRWTTLLKSTHKQKRNEYSSVPVIDMDVYEQFMDVRAEIDAADLVLGFPTAIPISYKQKKNIPLLEIYECVQTGKNILGFGNSSGLLNPNEPRLGVLLTNMGPIDQWNLNNLLDQDLKDLLLNGEERESWRVDTVFSVGYLKDPEKSPNSFISLESGSSPSGNSLPGTSSSRALRFGTQERGERKSVTTESTTISMLDRSSSSRAPSLLKKTLGSSLTSGGGNSISLRSSPSPVGNSLQSTSQSTSSSRVPRFGLQEPVGRTESTSISMLGRPPSSRPSSRLKQTLGLGAEGGTPSPSLSSGGGNMFLANFIKLMCLSAPVNKSVTLFCPTYTMGVLPELKLVGRKGGYTRYEGTLYNDTNLERQVNVVSGVCLQDDLLKLLNEAALSGEIHRRPILIGAPGEGTLSEIFSLQLVSMPVFPIYSPRYPYQKDNLLRLAQELLEDEKLTTLFSTIMSLHTCNPQELTALWTSILNCQTEMVNAHQLVQNEWNFMNRVLGRMPVNNNT
jgi:hypothetical protein